jgi:hypothetical protein
MNRNPENHVKNPEYYWRKILQNMGEKRKILENTGGKS